MLHEALTPEGIHVPQMIIRHDIGGGEPDHEPDALATESGHCTTTAACSAPTPPGFRPRHPRQRELPAWRHDSITAVVPSTSWTVASVWTERPEVPSRIRSEPPRVSWAAEPYAPSMAQQPSPSPSYDWEAPTASFPPAEAPVRDERAPATEIGSVPASGAAMPRVGMPVWSIVAITFAVVIGLLVAVGIAAAGVVQWLTAGESGLMFDDSEPVQSTVTDSSGTVVDDGTGAYDRPAVAGEHTFSSPTWDGGTADVSVTDVDTDATLPNASGADVLEDGYQLLLVTADVSYSGPGAFIPYDEVWVNVETDRHYVSDVGSGLVPDSLQGVGALRDGESATVSLAFVVDESQLDSALISIGTGDGEVLYYDVP